MWALIAPLFGSIASRFLAFGTLKLIAAKTLIYSFCTLILPTIILYIIMKFFEITNGYALSKMSGYASEPIILKLSGFAGWFGANLFLPECFSIILSALCLSFILRMFGK